MGLILNLGLKSVAQLVSSRVSRSPPDLYSDLKRLYITPLGIFRSMDDLSKVVDLQRRTLYRRFKDNREAFKDWFIIRDDDDTLPPLGEDLCKQCDDIDDELFAEDCWLDRVAHSHGTKLGANDTIVYLYKGEPYKITYSSWQLGARPHLINSGEKND
jgi:hypothetical protein